MQPCKGAVGTEGIVTSGDIDRPPSPDRTLQRELSLHMRLAFATTHDTDLVIALSLQVRK